MTDLTATAAPPQPKAVDAESNDTGLVSFLRGMSVSERRTMFACALGYALDGLDFMIYTLVLGTVIALWHVDRGAAGLTVTATLVCSAFGGWMAGYVSDRFGRVRAVQITVLWFALFSLLSAFAMSFTQLAIFRALLGFGFGGEWTAGAALMSEAIRPHYRGRAVGGVQSGWAVGWGAAVLLQAIVYSIVPEQQAWRWMFALGFVPALYVLFVRRYVEEPPLAAVARKGTMGSIWEIFSPDLLKTTILASLLGTGAQGGYYAVNTWLPLFLQTERHLTIVGSTSYLAFLIAGAFTGYLTGAWLADRIGRRKLFLLFSAGALVMSLIYTRAPVTNSVLWVLGFPLGFVASGYFAGMGAFFAELFPTRVRGSAMGFAYNFGRGIGATFPALVGYISATMPLSTAIAIFATIAYSLMGIAAFLLPETRGRTLTP
ncbi:MAG TPA: MFS transporter [Gemmatimonadaceae bacterium]|nr:MFS transporter [Gemmatimonadaceae bacterium]